MKALVKYAKGMSVWIPCEVKRGPFPNERRVRVKTDKSEWFGFVNVSKLEKRVETGSDRVRAVVVAVESSHVVVAVRGQSPASGEIQEAKPSLIQGRAALEAWYSQKGSRMAVYASVLNLGPKAIKQCSIDLRLAPIFTRFKKKENLHIGSLDIENVDAAFNAPDLWDIEEGKDICLLGCNDFVLSQTLETVTIPLDLMGLVEGRSSWARFGVSVHVTAPKIDPGFSAPITLEFTNHGSVPILLTAGKNRPCQLCFYRSRHQSILARLTVRRSKTSSLAKQNPSPPWEKRNNQHSGLSRTRHPTHSVSLPFSSGFRSNGADTQLATFYSALCGVRRSPQSASHRKGCRPSRSNSSAQHHSWAVDDRDREPDSSK